MIFPHHCEPAGRRSSARMAVTAAALLALLAIMGCGSKEADTAGTATADDAAARAAELRTSTSVPPQAKEQMLRQLEQQQQQPAGTAPK